MSEPRQDRGVVLIIVGLSLTVLMLFAAFAVDFGAARTARRKAQGTVDGGALAGGQLLVAEDGGLTGASADAVADEVIAVTYLNVTGDASMSDAGGLTAAEWRQRFESCSDPDRDTTRFPTVSTVSDCISFNAAMTRVRVRLPDLNVATYFASVIGVDDLEVDAFAEVDLIPGGSGGLLPFGVLGGVTGPEVCLKTGSQPNLPPCDGGENGNFGTLNFRFFGNPVLGTPETCDGAEVLRLAVNTAQGVDHRVSEYTGGAELHDDTACPDLAQQPNQIDGRPGMTAQTLDDGLVEGIDAATSPNGQDIAGRLTFGPWATRAVRTNAPALDDKPLWEFLPADLSGSNVPDLCKPSVTTISSKQGMVDCLDAYASDPTLYTAALFTADSDGDGPDILDSPRLAWVPQFGNDAVWGSGRKDYLITALRPVFLQTLYIGCSGSCAGVFEPGETGTGLPVADNNSNKAEALTALLLQESMLPQAVLDAGPEGDIAYTVVLRR